MSILSRLITFLPILALLGFPPGAAAQEASPWVQGHHSRVRLLAGGSEGAIWLAGVEIELDPGFKTYWRNPGEAGLPPSFDWSKSANVGAVEVLWPAPARSEDAGGVSYGYHDRVLFPLRVRPQDPAKPVSLAVKIDYGVCKDICIPAQAELTLKLPTTASAAARAPIDAALARVPKPQLLDADGDLAIIDARIMNGRTSKLAVSVRAPWGTTPTLFVEGPDNWFFQPTPDASQVTLSGPTTMRTLSIDVLERPREGARIDLRFTLVAGDKAIETVASLDAGPLER